MAVSLPPRARSTEGVGIEAADAAAQGGGRLATVISALAFVFSGLSYYESALKAADLEIHVPPIVFYGRDGGGDTELFAVPVTIANGGSNTGTVLSFDLTVENVSATDDLPKTKTYYSAFFGEHPRDAAAVNKAFAPISVPGRGTYTDTIRFYPQGNPLPRLVREGGDYRFTLKTNIATVGKPNWYETLLQAKPPQPLTFTRKLPFLSDQWLGFRRGSAAMHSADYQPTTSVQK
jgi:hypothetical protein